MCSGAVGAARSGGSPQQSRGRGRGGCAGVGDAPLCGPPARLCAGRPACMRQPAALSRSGHGCQQRSYEDFPMRCSSCLMLELIGLTMRLWLYWRSYFVVQRDLSNVNSTSFASSGAGGGRHAGWREGRACRLFGCRSQSCLSRAPSALWLLISEAVGRLLDLVLAFTGLQKSSWARLRRGESRQPHATCASLG